MLRELGCYSTICSKFDGLVMVRSDLASIDVMCCHAPYGTACFPFYRLRESIGYSRGKRRMREREPKAFRIVGSFFSFMRVPPPYRCQ